MIAYRLARAALRCYPRRWRGRYGEEVADLLESRPVRPRTVLDLARGALDAWASPRRTSPRGGVVAMAALAVFGVPLLFLWNPWARDVPSIDGVWALVSARHGFAMTLVDAASVLFALATAAAVAAWVPLLAHALVRTVRHRDGVAVLVPLVAALLLPVGGFFVYVHYGIMYFDLGFPLGPVGDAMTGGFFAPMVLAVGLALPAVARGAVPELAATTRVACQIYAVAAGLVIVAWLPVAVLIVLGLPAASSGFLGALAASAACSGAVCAAVTELSHRLRRPLPDPVPVPA